MAYKLVLTTAALLYMVVGEVQAQSARPDSSRAIRRLGLFELSGGVSYRRARMGTASAGYSINDAAGISGRVQSSVIWAYRATRPEKRFAWGDILAGEVFVGSLDTKMPHESGRAWVAYQFDFGFGSRYIISDRCEAGVNLILLRFSRDNVSGNLSGSSIGGRIRYGRIVAEAEAVARHDRALGVIIDLHQSVPIQGSFGVRYLMPRGRNAGMSVNSLAGVYPQDGFDYSKIWSVKIFYGIYF